jgi:hypothetical protein
LSVATSPTVEAAAVTGGRAFSLYARLAAMARKPKTSEPVGIDEIMDTVKRALLSFQGRPVSLDDTIQALSLVSFELKQATLKLLSEQEATTMKRRPK